MIVANQIIEAKWHSKNKEHYILMGYPFTKFGQIFQVRAEDLPENVHVKIKVECDNCEKIKELRKSSISVNEKYYCSSACKKKDGVTRKEKSTVRIETKCTACDTLVFRKPSEFKGHGKHFCSRSCLAKKKCTENNPNPKKDKVIVNCNFCDSAIPVFESVYKKNKWHFCSRECYSSFRSSELTGENSPSYEGVTATCDLCNTEYPTVNSTIERNKNLFCSQECYAKFRSIHYSGENHNQFGIKKSPEQIEKMRIATATRIANGEFPQTNTSIHIKIKEMLDEDNLKFEEETQFKYYVLDFYDKANNLAIEVMGDYWHSNPLKYLSYDELHKIQKKGIKRDKSKSTYLKKYYDIDILYLWEGDINNNPILCQKLTEEYCNNNGVLKDYNSFNYSISNNNLILNETIVKPFSRRVNTELQTLSS